MGSETKSSTFSVSIILHQIGFLITGLCTTLGVQWLFYKGAASKYKCTPSQLKKTHTMQFYFSFYEFTSSTIKLYRHVACWFIYTHFNKTKKANRFRLQCGWSRRGILFPYLNDRLIVIKPLTLFLGE